MRILARKIAPRVGQVGEDPRACVRLVDDPRAEVGEDVRSVSASWNASFIALSVQLCVPCDGRGAVRRAGPSAAAETCFIFTSTYIHYIRLDVMTLFGVDLLFDY